MLPLITGDPALLTPPHRFDSRTWTVSRDIWTWSRWIANAGGSPIPWGAGWGDALPKCAANDRWHVQRTDGRLTILLMLQAPVNWSDELTRLDVWLDRDRTHQQYLRTEVHPDRLTRHFFTYAARSTAVWDYRQWEKPCRTGPQVRQTIKDKRWFVQIEYPFDHFKALRRRPNVGLNLSLHARGPDGTDDVVMLGADGKREAAPWRFIDLSLSDCPLDIVSVTFETLNMDRNSYEVVLRNRSDATVHGTLIAKVTADDYRFRQSESFSVAARGHTNVRSWFEPDHRAGCGQRLALSVRCARKTVWAAIYRMACMSTRPGHALTLKHTMPSSVPERVADGYQRKRLEILERLPQFRRVPVDVLFTDKLVCDNSKIVIDLHKEEAVRLLANCVADRFDSEEDKLAGLAFLVHQIMTYTRQAGSVITELPTIHKLRLGMAQCGDITMTLRDMIRQLVDPRTKQPYRAEYLTTGHAHVVLLVWCGRRKTVLDPTYGVVYFDQHCRKLASLEQLINNATLVRQAITGRNDFTSRKTLTLLPIGRSRINAVASVM